MIRAFHGGLSEDQKQLIKDNISNGSQDIIFASPRQ